MRHRVPGHWKETGFKIVFDLERLYQPGICPFSYAVVRPEKDIGTLAALGRSLELFIDLLLRFNLNRGTNISFKSFAEVT